MFVAAGCTAVRDANGDALLLQAAQSASPQMGVLLQQVMRRLHE